MISDGTSILDLLRTFEKKPFCFVLSHAEIAGYVHFSDLNLPFVKLALYTIIEATESSALAMIDSILDHENLARLLAKKRFKTIKKRLDAAQKKDANRSLWLDFLTIEDILRIARKENKILLNEQEIKAIYGNAEYSFAPRQSFGQRLERDHETRSNCTSMCRTARGRVTERPILILYYTGERPRSPGLSMRKARTRPCERP